MVAGATGNIAVAAAASGIGTAADRIIANDGNVSKINVTEVAVSVGLGEATNFGSGTAARGYTYLLNDVKPTSQRGMIDRALNKVSPISSALGSYGVR